MTHFFAALPAAALGSATILGLPSSTTLILTFTAIGTASVCAGILHLIRRDGK